MDFPGSVDFLLIFRQKSALQKACEAAKTAQTQAFLKFTVYFCKKYLTKGGKNDNIFFVLSTSYADVAQLAEQLTCNQQVIGSSPIIGFFLAYLQEKNLILFKLR